LGALIKLIEEIKSIKIPKVKLKRALVNLQGRKIINLEKKDGEIYVKVKNIFKPEILKYSIQSLLDLKKKKQWKHKWFLVVFDVPEEERNKRYRFLSVSKERLYFSL
jgi:DNA-binding transcriptional regulator PaaX